MGVSLNLSIVHVTRMVLVHEMNIAYLIRGLNDGSGLEIVYLFKIDYFI